MKYTINIVLALFAIIFTACEEENILIKSDVAVVEAYLIPNQPISQIKLSKLIPYSTNEDVVVYETIDNAEIKITSNNNVYYLTPSVDNAGYYYLPDTSVKVIENTQYTLEFTYNDKQVSATTFSPVKPDNFIISDTTIYMERFEPSSSGPPNMDNSTYDIIWDNPDNSYYFLVIELIEDNPDPINEQMANAPTSSKTKPSISDVYNISSRTIRYFGLHRVVLYKVNQEYVDLYENISQNSISMTEPLTNIVNGKGVFTSFNTDTLYYDVVEQ